MKKLIIIALAAALVVTLHSTNPSMLQFADFYEKGEWLDDDALLDSFPEELDEVKAAIAENTFDPLEIRKDLYIASIYNFGGRQFIGIAGDFHLLAE